MELGKPGKYSKSSFRWLDLLKPLPIQTKVFDNVSLSDSNSSDLSGPFSEAVFNVEFENKRKAKELYGKDLYTGFSFSPEFKTAIEGIKKEMINENSDYLNTSSIVAVDFKEPQGNEKEEETVEYVRFPDIDFEIELKGEEVEEKKKDKEDEKEKKKKMWLEDDEAMFDTMSGYWRLLSVFDEFRISPPWYDAFAEGKEHWLNTKPIPSHVLENSRKKCMNWLSKYFNK